ncbi:MAG TPA: hypothetical protein DEP24_08570 [Mycobacterium sp.]|nr:hypothetical protein [Mycobacterium sp.]
MTPSYGFNFTGNKVALNFTGTKTDINAALATMQLSTGAAQGAIEFDVTSSLSAANTYYNPINNSYYQYFASPNTTWTAARLAATGKSLYGSTGYLANITTNIENEFTKSYINAQNVWIGASDAAVEGVWRWMDGPEAGIQFWQGSTVASGGFATGPYSFASWATNEPNNNNGREHYGTTNFRGTLGAWNDVQNSSALVQGYLVEYTEPVGGWTPASVSQQVTSAYIGTADGGIGGNGGAGGLGGNGALGGLSGGTASAGGVGGIGGVGGQGGEGGKALPGNGGTGGTGGPGGGGGTSGTGNAGIAGSTGTAGTNGSGTTGGAGGSGGTAGTGGVV